MFYLAVSKYWVININAFSGVNPRKDQVFLQTWHGTPLKKNWC
ncbi:CDP-glycerol glycerophosphotransferase family protein [Halobaculum halobium]|uniref:CDP-glycerol glycerophosphotransferase family protein n=1 Tax=Halobaculum halobium TaxID=3032281 RepID=A0ABD5TJB7_9EURY